MNWLLLGASALSFATCAIHLFSGGPTIARPLLAARDLDPIAKLTNYYCWHIVSIVLCAMAIAFLLGALRARSRELAMLVTTIAAAFTLWSLALTVWKRRRPLELPQWLLFLPITILGALGVLR